jgi:hydroxymethylglutaryl-CoA lyase
MSNHVRISEVGPRDGLQIEPAFLETRQKIALIDALSASGLRLIEAASFAHPKIVPQMRDAEAVMFGIQRPAGVRFGAFIPNAKGAERAIAAHVDDLKVGAAASDAFSELNVRMTVDKNLAILQEIADLARGTDCALVAVVGTAFGCPYSGAVPVERVLRIVDRYAELGITLTYFADTTGMASPREIRTVVEAVRARHPEMTLGLHLHNTRGLGIANALTGLELGIRDFESSIGGLGGCPFAPRAVGNISTEDFAHMVLQMGYTIDPDIDALIRCAELVERSVGHVVPGMVMKAGKTTDLHGRPLAPAGT